MNNGWEDRERAEMDDHTMSDKETTTWRRVTCQERDVAFAAWNGAWGVGSSLTDFDGQYGDPQMFTEWWDKATERPVLRDRRYPGRPGQPDPRPCEHYLAERTTP